MPRSPERLRVHYELEKKLAQRILASAPDRRTQVTMDCYDEMYRTITDHPYFQLTEADQRTREENTTLFSHMVGTGHDVLELGCGLGDRAGSIARMGNQVTGLEISEEIVAKGREQYREVRFVVDDAVHLRNVDDNAFDVVLSSQLIEHFHPEDVPAHIEAVARVLRPGGRYIFDTPNRLLGPADISKYFGDKRATGFHLREWTYRELRALMREKGFTRFRSPWGRKQSYLAEPRRIDRAMLPVEWKIPFERLAETVDRKRFSQLLSRPLILEILIESQLGDK